jgi:hypothetical protein
MIADLGYRGSGSPTGFRAEVPSAATSTLIRPPTSELPHVVHLLFIAARSRERDEHAISSPARLPAGALLH